MENAADALKMAAAILIFVVAIASSFSLFGTAKQTADSIITMRDKQVYLDAATLDGIMYTSSDKISSGKVDGFTTEGYRIVTTSDVVSSIYRYNKEKYSVTIIRRGGEVLARFDTNTESVIENYNAYGEEFFQEYKEIVRKNIKTYYTNAPKFTSTDKIEDLYKISGKTKTKYGAPWLVNDEQIQKRISADLTGETYEYIDEVYDGKGLLDILNSSGMIIEVTNEIDQSKYLSDTNEENEKIETSLLQQYEMPTVEIIYIVH